MKTKVLAQQYADAFSDVSLIRVAKNGRTATFREASPTGGREFTLTRKYLETCYIIETPHGVVEVQ